VSDDALSVGGRSSDAWNIKLREMLREDSQTEVTMGRGLLLWLIGIPLPIILLIWLFGGLH
jgi:hypothetical protein